VEQNTFNRTLLILLASVLVIGTVVFVYYNFSQKPSRSFYQSLLEKNENFAYAEGLLKSRKFDEAAQNFRLALTEANGFREVGQIKYKIAVSQSEGSNPIEGIVLLKEIAANVNYTTKIRAYSIQHIGHLLYAINTKEINDEIFKDEPYKSFLSGSENDYSIARRKLYEYASSIYPLGIPELRIAKWYSEEILRLQKLSGEDNKQKIEGMKSIIGQKMISADKYLADIVNSEQSRSFAAEVLYRKANVQADLYLAGDKNFGDPEENYKKSLNVAILKVGNESSASIRYAVFLAEMYGEKRLQDIKALLAGFYSGRYDATNTVRSIRNEKNGLLGNKNDYLLLAKLDPMWRDFLISLGWTF